jgi:hypothetical protein
MEQAIFVADDNRSFAELLRATFEEAGYEGRDRVDRACRDGLHGEARLWVRTALLCRLLRGS